MHAPARHDSPLPRLARPWTGPCGGVPPLAGVAAADFEPAIEAGMAEQIAALERIGADAEPATFTNTNVPYELSGRSLERALAVYETYTAGLSDDAVQEVERQVAPRLAAHADRIVQDERLCNRIAAVFAGRDQAGLGPEAQRLAWLQHTDLVRAGARLDATAKHELAAVNAELAALHTTFSQNVLRDEAERTIHLTVVEDLQGLPEPLRDAARQAALAAGLPGWVIANTRSAVEPFLVHASRRDLRERVWRMFVGRGDGGGATDNNAVAARILLLRARRARLLGYPTHAHWRLEHSMAGTPERAVALMEAVWKPAVARVRDEVAALQAVADQEAAGIRIAAWDYRHYAEKVRLATYDLDQAEVLPHLQLDNLREGMFFTAERLFGLVFEPVTDGSVPVHHPDVRVWRVLRRDGGTVGLWYFDPFARTGKRSGAWMGSFRPQHGLDGGAQALVSNTCNFARPAPGEPVLVSWDDARTLFHEFGHALHGLLSAVEFPSLSGTNVARDFVELPSQVLEHWLATPEVLERFALHVRTGRPIAPDLVARLRRAETCNAGFQTVEYLASAIVDMRLHLAGDVAIDPRAFERETLAALGMPAEIVMRHRIPHFNHVFADDGYAAGYYSYLWADTLAADAWEAFQESPGGAWDAGVAGRFQRHVLAAGNTVDPAVGYRLFRGRDPRIDALLRQRGFA